MREAQPSEPGKPSAGPVTRADRIDGGAAAIQSWLLETEQPATARKLALRLSAAVLLGADEAEPKHPSTSALTDRLRGTYIVPVNDGAGLLDGKDTFTRAFTTPPIQHAAAQLIDLLTAALVMIADGAEDASGIAEQTLAAACDIG